MATSFDAIYDKFLMKISDFSFLKMTEEELEDDFLKYLRSACVNFRQCEKNLFNNFNETELQFNVDLDPYELEILSLLMVIEYLTPHIVATENLKQIIGNREFQFYSQANLLSELSKLRKMLRLEATQLISEYTYARGLDGLE
jgi:hypothetical protein